MDGASSPPRALSWRLYTRRRSSSWRAPRHAMTVASRLFLAQGHHVAVVVDLYIFILPLPIGPARLNMTLSKRLPARSRVRDGTGAVAVGRKHHQPWRTGFPVSVQRLEGNLAREMACVYRCVSFKSCCKVISSS